MSISLDPMRSGPGTQLSGGVRVLSQDEQEKLRREQDMEQRKSKFHTPDKDAFFLEYFKYRDKKVAQSVTKLAKVMAKAKADDLSKTVDEDHPPQVDNALDAVAKELGVSPEALTITVEQAGGETAAFSSAIKELAAMASHKDIEERFESKMVSGEEDKDAKEPGWAQTLRAKAALLEESALAAENGVVATGTPPDAQELRAQAKVFRAVAALVERTEKAAASGQTLSEEIVARLKELDDVTDLDSENAPALLADLERMGVISREEAQSAGMMAMYIGVAGVSSRETRFDGGDLLENLRQRIAAGDKALAALADPGAIFTGNRDEQRAQIQRMQGRHRSLLQALEQLA